MFSNYLFLYEENKKFFLGIFASDFTSNRFKWWLTSGPSCSLHSGVNLSNSWLCVNFFLRLSTWNPHYRRPQVARLSCITDLNARPKDSSRFLASKGQFCVCFSRPEGNKKHKINTFPHKACESFCTRAPTHGGLMHLVCNWAIKRALVR
jgi:hypothetical protein